MQKRIGMTLLLLLAVGMASAQTAKPATKTASKAAAKAQQGPAVGTWKLNVQKSDFGSMPAPKSARIVITSDTRQLLKYTVTEVGPDGKVKTESFSGAMDGKPYPVKGEPGVTMAYTPRENGIVEIAGQSPHGAFKETGIMADDHNTLTIKGEASGPQGTATWTEVYERVGTRKPATKKEHTKAESAKQQ